MYLVVIATLALPPSAASSASSWDFSQDSNITDKQRNSCHAYIKVITVAKFQDLGTKLVKKTSFQTCHFYEIFKEMSKGLDVYGQ